MPYPTEYSSASAEFDRFLDAVKANAMLQTRHQAWQVARAVFLVFRGHLSADEALRFADALPPLLRAMFVEGLSAGQASRPFGDPAMLLRAVAAIRPDHNFIDESSIAAVSAALRAACDAQRLA
ncbi:MAG: DUF2267 domain-containing protein, partial [Rhizobiaceae bacterium]